MNKGKKILGLGLLAITGFGVYYAGRQVYVFKNMQTSIVNANPRNISNTNIDVDATIRFTNNSAMNLYISKLDLEIIVAGGRVGTINEVYEPNVLIPKNGQGDIDVTFNFNPMSALGGSVLSLLDNAISGDAFNILLKGNISGGNKIIKLANHKFEDTIKILG